MNVQVKPWTTAQNPQMVPVRPWSGTHVTMGDPLAEQTPGLKVNHARSEIDNCSVCKYKVLPGMLQAHTAHTWT